jgi:hypothetical protein
MGMPLTFRRVTGLALRWMLVSCALALPRVAEACSCPTSPPCVTAWQADAVFVGTALGATSERLGVRSSWTVDNVAVGQVLRGSAEAVVTMVPGRRPSAEEIKRLDAREPDAETVRSTCDYQFAPGKVYLVYAHRMPDGRWYKSHCSGTKPIEEAAADLDYFLSLASAAPGGQLFGEVTKSRKVLPSGSVAPSVPAAHARIELTNERHRVVVVADEDGRIDARVPSGRYSVRAPGFTVAYLGGRDSTVTLPDKGCAPFFVSLVENGP